MSAICWKILLGSGGNHHIQYFKQKVKHNPDTLKYLLYAWGCSKSSLWKYW